MKLEVQLEGGMTYTKITVLLAYKVRANNGQDTVPQPIRCGGETDTTGSDRKWKSLANDNPSGRPPSRSEECNGKANEGDHSRCSRLVVGANGCTDDSREELASEHAQGTVDQQWAASESLDGPEGNWRGTDIDEGGNQRNQEGILNRS